mmetsp:Transcript_20424/g.42805  ORF Transcript_20424/g.42805 Transcript_20424/m.42805 type:complete len:271 (-) Transcript_20424:28-840(-)
MVLPGKIRIRDIERPGNSRGGGAVEGGVPPTFPWWPQEVDGANVFLGSKHLLAQRPSLQDWREVEEEEVIVIPKVIPGSSDDCTKDKQPVVVLWVLYQFLQLFANFANGIELLYVVNVILQYSRCVIGTLRSTPEELRCHKNLQSLLVIVCKLPRCFHSLLHHLESLPYVNFIIIITQVALKAIPEPANPCPILAIDITITTSRVDTKTEELAPLVLSSSSIFQTTSLRREEGTGQHESKKKATGKNRRTKFDAGCCASITIRKVTYILF